MNPSPWMLCLALAATAVAVPRAAEAHHHGRVIRIRVHQPYAPPPPPRVVVRTQPVVIPAPVVRPLPAPEPEPEPSPWESAYDTPGIVIVGTGAGGLVSFGSATQVAPVYRLHLGLAVDEAEFALRFNLAPDALAFVDEAGAANSGSLYTVGGSFSYRFLPRAVVHPVAGAGLESIILNPEQGSTGSAFGGTIRGGLELAYPLADGALALGLDVSGHFPFAVTADYATEADPFMTFGAYADFRF